MALGQITGQMLSGTLNRVTTDIKFASTGEANLLHLDTTNNRVGVAKDPAVPLDVTGAIAGTTTITAGTSVIGGTCTVAAGSITDSSGAITFGNENLVTTGTLGSGVATLASSSTIGNLTLANGSITDSSGAITFGNENLVTTGTFGSGIATLASSSIIGNLTLGDGSIVDSSGAISFGNENLTTTGQINTSGVRLLENEITTIRSNDDLVLSANGTGGVQIEGSLTVSADLTVNGSTTTVNSTTLTVDDKNIELAHSPSGASASDTLADGGGLILKGSTDHTILWTNATDDWDFSDSIDLASGKTFKINGTTVVSATNVAVATGTFSGATTHGSIQIGGSGATVTGILDEDAMGSDSAVKLATQQSIKAYVDAFVGASSIVTTGALNSGSITSGFGSIDNGTSGIRTNTFTAETSLVPDASGGADIGTTALEWGDVYIADDKFIYAGSDQDIKIGYDETTNDALEISQNVEGAGLAIVLKADQGDDAGDEWKLNVADGGVITLGNDIASAGTYVTQLTVTPHATVTSSTVAVAGLLTAVGVTIGGDGATVTGIKDEDNMASDSAVKLATQQSIKAYVDATVATADTFLEMSDTPGSYTASAILATNAAGNAVASAELLYTVSSNDITLANGTSNKDIIFQVNDGGSGTEVMRLDGDVSALKMAASKQLQLGAAEEHISGDGTDITIAVGAGGDINIGSAIGLTFGDDGEKIEGDGTDLTIASSADLHLTATNDINVPADVGLTFGNDGEKIEGDGTDLTITGNTINLTATTDVALAVNTGILMAGTEKMESDGTDLSFTSGADFIFKSTGGATNILLPSGTTGQRAGTDAGQMRYNTTTGSFEGYSGSGWGSLGGGDLILVDDSSSSVTTTLADDSVSILGGANITTSISGNGVSIALDGAVAGLTTLTVDNININGNTVTASTGDITLTPAGSGDVNIGANLGLTFGDDGEKIEGDGTDLTIASSNLLNLTATTDIQVPANVGVLFGTGGEKIESDGTDLTATITGNMVISGTGGMQVPAGTTGQRPSVANGLIRYNSSLGSFEGCTDGSTYVQFVTATTGQAADINKDVFTTSNASTTAFALSYTPAEVNNIIVYVDNIMQEPTQNFTLSGSTLTMTSAPHSGARVIVMHGFDSKGGISGAAWLAGSNTDVDSAIENVDTFTTATFSSAEYSYMAKNAEGTGDSTTGYEAGKIIVVHDGTTPQMTQYGITHTSTAPLLTFSVDIDSGSVRLRAASIAANTKIKFARLGFAPF